MIKLHIGTTPNGQTISIALEELGIPYEVHPVNLGKNEQMAPEFLKLNPNHKIPVIEDGGQVIWESGAILLHLGEKHDPDDVILPKDPRKRMEAIDRGRTGDVQLGQPS
jgi:GST-like protein